MKEKSVNVVLTSPPYWPLQRTYGGKGLGFEKKLTDYLANLVAILRQTKRVLRDDGALWINLNDTYVDGDLQFIPTRLAMMMQADGWICRAEVVWLKTNTRPESVDNRPSRDFEKVLMFVKGKRYFYNPVRIPAQGGQVFRSDRGHCSELMAATIPI